jgi:DNA-binding MarR family transcriptional regulator
MLKFLHCEEELMADAIDAVIDQWGRVRPDVDLWPMHILGRIARLSRVLEKENKKFLAEHGLESFEFDVLTTLRRSGDPYELTASALLKATLVTSGAITNRIDRMEVKGLVERVRDHDDRRSVRIRLTSHGLEALDAIFGLHIANMERILQPLDQQTREQLASALRILLESFGDTSLS